MIVTWPPAKRFPAIDIIRLAASKAHSEVCRYQFDNRGIVDILIIGAELTDGVAVGRKELDTNALLAIRAFVNLFEGDEGVALMKTNFEKVFILEMI